jgi:hypothetical protein
MNRLMPAAPGFKMATDRPIDRVRPDPFSLRPDPMSGHSAYNRARAPDPLNGSQSARTSVETMKSGRRDMLMKQGQQLGMSPRLEDSASSRGAAFLGRGAAPAQPLRYHVDHPDDVLSFSACFTENLNSGAVSSRVRKFTILYYLRDGQLEISEPRQINSGIPQGKFLNKGLATLPNGDRLTWSDIRVGQDLTIHGIYYSVYDADPFTRNFFDSKGQPQPEAAPPPADEYQHRREAERTVADSSHAKTNNSLKTYKEAMLGNTILAHKINNSGQGPEAGEWRTQTPEVLCFQCEHIPTGVPTWNQTSIRHAVLPIIYTLQYYTVDGTVEITEKQQVNSGLGPFVKLLSRRRMPKRWQHDLNNDYRRGCGDNLDLDGPEHYYAAADLVVGLALTAYGKTLTLVACDEHTRAWYAEKLGVAQPQGKLWERPESAKVNHPVPAPTGYGEEEDSLGSVLHLVPKRPKGKERGYLAHGEAKLRFEMELTDNPIWGLGVAVPNAGGNNAPNKARKMILLFHLCDGTMSIFETKDGTPDGLAGGPFLHRDKHAQAGGGAHTVQSLGRALQTGELVTFMNAFHFRLLRADEGTKAYLSQNLASN